MRPREVGLRQLAAVASAAQRMNSEPAPVHAVSTNQSALQLHHLDEIHLISVWSLPRILPHEQLPVTKGKAPMSTPHSGLIGEYLGNEGTDRLLAAAYPAVSSK